LARQMCSEREVAKANGRPTYFTGNPCKRGHVAERFVSTYTCVECSRLDLYKTERDRYRTAESTLLYQFRQRRNSAIKNGIPFTIEYEELAQPEFCPVLGIKLNYGWGGTAGHLRDPAKATIDKVIPELGYVPGNVFIISWRANKLKSNMTLDELEKIVKYMKERI